MKEHQILFQGAMVRAILAGQKTQTRRIARLNPRHEGTPLADDEFGHGIPRRSCPYGQPGDRLWVRETFFAYGRWDTRYSEKKKRDEWHFIDMTEECGKDYLYAADGVTDTQMFIKRRSSASLMYWKRPAIHMPRRASRILLEIVSVRVERLQDISEEDARAEGTGQFIRNGLVEATNGRPWEEVAKFADTPFRGAYGVLWEQINGAGSWAKNPWVWVVEFKRVA